MISRLFTFMVIVLAATGYPVAAKDFSSPPPASNYAGITGTRLILLGTGGGPLVHRARSQPAALIVVDGRPYLFDCGDGTVRQLKLAGFRPMDVARVFLSHLHFDHVAGVSALLGYNWVSDRRQVIQIFGPPGTYELIQGAVKYLHIPEYLYGLQLPPHPSIIDTVSAHDIKAGTPTVFYQDDKVKVSAVENSHYATMSVAEESYGRTKSYSYRFETADRTIVFTGDTGPSPAVEKLAQGADILVSEVINLDAVIKYMRSAFQATDAQMEALVEHQRKEHLTPSEVGKLAKAANVKMVVLSHVSPDDDVALDALIYTKQVRKYYSGPVVLGSDLDQF